MGFFDRVFNPSEMRVVELTRKDIESSNFGPLYRTIRLVMGQGMRGLEKLLISFPDYGNEQPFENERVRDFFSVVLSKFPALFLFIADYRQNKLLISLIYGEYSYPNDNPVELDVIIPKTQAKIIVRNCLEYIRTAFVDEDDMWRILRKYPLDYDMPDPDDAVRMLDAEKEDA